MRRDLRSLSYGECRNRRELDEQRAIAEVAPKMTKVQMLLLAVTTPLQSSRRLFGLSIFPTKG